MVPLVSMVPLVETLVPNGTIGRPRPNGSIGKANGVNSNICDTSIHLTCLIFLFFYVYILEMIFFFTFFISNTKYTMHNIFSNFSCFASLFAHLHSILNNFKCNGENWILGK